VPNFFNWFVFLSTVPYSEIPKGLLVLDLCFSECPVPLRAVHRGRTLFLEFLLGIAEKSNFQQKMALHLTQKYSENLFFLFKQLKMEKKLNATVYYYIPVLKIIVQFYRDS